MGGFVARLQDVAHLRHSQAVFSGLRLDYQSSPFHSLLDGPIQMIRYRREAGTLEVPFDECVAGHPTGFTDLDPFTGKGYTASGIPIRDGDLIPEFYASRGTRMQTGAEMWEVTPGGTYRMLAILDDLTGGWVSVGGWKPDLP